MKARFDAGTGVAMIGAWDAARGAEPFSAEEYRQLSETLDADAAAGRIFVLHTGADGGGPVDVYIDEPVPPDVMERLTTVGDPCVLALPSGSLDVDGAEHYRARKPEPARSSRAVSVPAGDYLLRCYTPRDQEQVVTPRSERDLEAAVGADDLRYYERVTRTGCLTGLLLPLLFPLLLPFFGWKGAVAATIVIVVGYFSVRERLLRRNPRFARLRETVTSFRLQHDGPTFVLELRRIDDRADLTGES